MSWIDKQGGKHLRVKAAQQAMKARVERHAADLGEIKTFRREQDEDVKRRVTVQPRGIKPGERRLPDLSDEELADALGRADPALPRHLAYPHLLILRQRGLTRMVFADTGGGDFGVPSFRGDVLTEEGARWLKHTTGPSA